VKKTKMKKIGIVLAALVIVTGLSIAFSGVALAAQTSFSVAVVDGTVRTQSSHSIATHGALPYDIDEYSLDVYAVHSNTFGMEHSSDTDSGVEAETSVSYTPASNLKLIFVDEELKKARVAEGDNKSLCYGANAETRITAQVLGYESAAISDSNNVAFALNVVGVGSLNIETMEKVGSGDSDVGESNSSWTESLTYEQLKVRGGMFNATAMFTSEVPEYPAMPDREDMLCPFFKNWG